MSWDVYNQVEGPSESEMDKIRPGDVFSFEFTWNLANNKKKIEKIWRAQFMMSNRDKMGENVCIALPHDWQR